jgi:hypothetical protein
VNVPRTIANPLALWVWAVIALLSLGAIVLALIAPDQGNLATNILATVSAAAAFGPIGALIVRRRGNAVGWALLGIGGGLAASMFTLQYGIASATHAVALPAWQWVTWGGLLTFVLTGGAVALLSCCSPPGRCPPPGGG